MTRPFNLVAVQDTIAGLQKKAENLEYQLSKVHEQMNIEKDHLEEHCPHPEEFIRYEKHVGDDPGCADTHIETCTICDKELFRSYSEREYQEYCEKKQ